MSMLKDLIALHPDEDSNKLKVWACELDIAKKILTVCEKYNLKIWAEGGTMLGAVRHKGFIPWDDDMDFMMLRPDYEKLLEVAHLEFEEPYFFQTAYSEKKYFRGHAQVRNSNTAAILPSDIWQDFNQGVFVDIFVYDDVPVNKEDRNVLYKDLENRRSEIITNAYGSFLCRNPFKMAKNWWHFKNNSIKEAYIEMENLFSKRTIHSNSMLNFAVFSSKLEKRFTTPIEWLNETIYMDFENIQIPIPKKYDNLLKTRFGDYMEPRKESSQHGSVIFNTEKSYKDVLIELRRNAPVIEKLKHFFSLSR